MRSFSTTSCRIKAIGLLTAHRSLYPHPAMRFVVEPNWGGSLAMEKISKGELLVIANPTEPVISSAIIRVSSILPPKDGLSPSVLIYVSVNRYGLKPPMQKEVFLKVSVKCRLAAVDKNTFPSNCRSLVIKDWA